MLTQLGKCFFKCFAPPKETKPKNEDVKYHEFDCSQFDLSFGPDNSNSNFSISDSSTSSFSGSN